MTTAVHQLLPVYSVGDAISGAVGEMQKMLRTLGYRSEVYADLIDERHGRRARTADRLPGDLEPGDAVMYHLSIGSPLAQLMARLDARRIIVYHNITPSAFYRDTSPRVTYWLDRGREDLHRLAPVVDLCIGDSQYNLDDLDGTVVRARAVLPPPVDLSRLAPRPSAPADPPMILFVGRLAPNKRHDQLLRVLAALRATGSPHARLVLAGAADDTGAYVAALRRLAERLGIADHVEVPAQRLTDADLGALYSRAAVFACASDHEGFCIPLLEAMAFSVPIVAHSAGAVPETLGDGGLIVRHHDPLVWAAVITRVLADEEVRRCLVGAAQRRLRDFAPAVVARRLGDLLTDLGIVP